MFKRVWLAAVALGCGQPAPPQAPRTQEVRVIEPDAGVVPPRLADDLPALAARARLLYLDWQRAFADDTLDCATATARTTDLADRYADVIEANRELMRAGHDKIKAFRAELDKYEAEIGPAARSVIESPIMSRCASDPAFARATDRLAGDG